MLITRRSQVRDLHGPDFFAHFGVHFSIFPCSFFQCHLPYLSMHLQFYVSPFMAGLKKKTSLLRDAIYQLKKKLKSVRFTGMDPPFFCPFRHAHRHGARKATNALRAATCQATNRSRPETSARLLHARACSCCATTLRARVAPLAW